VTLLYSAWVAGLAGQLAFIYTPGKRKAKSKLSWFHSRRLSYVVLLRTGIGASPGHWCCLRLPANMLARIEIVQRGKTQLEWSSLCSWLAIHQSIESLSYSGIEI